MGILRTLLAISVFLVHSQPNDFLIGGQLSVQLFYMISGFLISFILTERKSYKNIKDFYLNRFLRIYPIYFLTSLITLLFYLFSHYLGNEKNSFLIFYENEIKIISIVILSNIVIFFQDLLFFLGIENNSFVFLRNYLNSEIILTNGLIVPQSWTLALEFSFYIIAPFVVKKMRLMILLIIISLFLKFFLYTNGLADDPWNYRFFPNEISLFLLGSLSHQLFLEKFRKYSIIFKNLPLFSTLFLIILIFLYPLINKIYFFEKGLLLFFLFFFLIPFTFIFSNQNSWDRNIGELSYPIYIIHISIINFTAYIMKENSIFYSVSIVSLLMTILFSIFINLYLNKPLEKLRNNFKTKIFD